MAWKLIGRPVRSLWVLGAVLVCGAGPGDVWASEPGVLIERESESLIEPALDLVGAAPTPRLIAAMAKLSAEPGSLAERDGEREALSDADRWQERVSREIKIRLYDEQTTTRLDRWLFMRAARRESAAVLTDPTAARGNVYRYVLNAWLRQGRLSFEDERWVRSVHQVRTEQAGYAIDHYPTYARVQIRRLAEGGRWRVRLGERLFESRGRAWPEGRDGFVDLRPVGLAVNGWWDGNVLVDRHMYTGNGIWGGTPAPISFTRTISGRIFEGDQHADVWWPVARVSYDIEFRIAAAERAAASVPPERARPRIESIGGFEIMDDAEAVPLLDWIARGLEVRLRTQGEPWDVRGDGLPDEFVLFIGHGGRAPAKLPAFTFGGRAAIVLDVQRGGGDPASPRVDTVTVFESDPAWWALRDEVDAAGKRVFEHGWLRVGMGPTTWFRSRGGVIPGSEEGLAQNDTVLAAWLEVRFGTDVMGDEGFRALSDLEAERILTHPVRIPIGHGPFQNASALRSDGVRLPDDRAKWPGAGAERD